MNLFQVIRSPKVYDVCIVGSGAAGGAAAKVLTERGFDVVLLEAGPMLDVSKHYTEHTWTLIAVTAWAAAATIAMATANWMSLTSADALKVNPTHRPRLPLLLDARPHSWR
jgi:choline dehydrogenase-like flavoprotein